MREERGRGEEKKRDRERTMRGRGRERSERKEWWNDGVRKGEREGVRERRVREGRRE